MLDWEHPELQFMLLLSVCGEARRAASRLTSDSIMKPVFNSEKWTSCVSWKWPTLSFVCGAQRCPSMACEDVWPRFEKNSKSKDSREDDVRLQSFNVFRITFAPMY
jgi:hypothetical protein